MRHVSAQERAHILHTLAECKGNSERAATKLGLAPSLVRWVDVVENRKFGYTEQGKGRPELQAYIVGVRNIEDSEGWNNKEPKIAKAREDYDKGLIEMATGRDGMNLILYAIPRRVKLEREHPYFGRAALRVVNS